MTTTFKNSLLRRIVLIIFITNLLWIGYLFLKSKLSHREHYIETLGKIYTKFENKKIDFIVSKLQNYYNELELNLHETLKQRNKSISEIIKLAYSLNDNIDLNKNISSVLKELNFFDYEEISLFNIDGRKIYSNSALINQATNPMLLSDNEGNYIIKDEISIAKNKGNGFFKSFWADKLGKTKTRISYISYIPEKKIVIIVSSFENQFFSYNKNKIINDLRRDLFEHQTSFFVLDDNLNFVLHSDERLKGKTVSEISTFFNKSDFQSIYKKILDKSQASLIVRSVENDKLLITFEYDPNWHWYIGFYQNLTELINSTNVQQNENSYFLKSLLIFFLLEIIVISFFAFWIFKPPLNSLEQFLTFVDDFNRSRNKELEFDDLNKLSKKIEYCREDKNKEKSKFLMVESLINQTINFFEDFFYIKDKEGNFLYANEKFLTTYKKSSEEIFGKNVYDIFPIDRAKIENDKDKLVYSTKKEVTFEVHTYTEEHKNIILHIKKIPIISDNEVQAIATIVRDVTDLTSKNEELLQFKSIVENINIGVYILDLSMKFIYLNEYFSSIHGYKKDELYKMNYYELINEKTRPFINHLKKTLLSTYSIKNLEVYHFKKNKEEIPVLLNCNLVNDINGNPKYIIGSCYNLSHIKETEVELRALSTAIEQSSNMIFITDILGEITYVNKAFINTMGYTLDEVLGKNVSMFRTNYHSESFYENLWATISSGKEWRGEFLNKKKDGSHCWIRSVITPVFNEDDEIINYISIQEDVTSEKKMLEELNNARIQAEKANVAKSHFLANMSHEIRTPMNGIIGITSILLESGLTSEQRELADLIKVSSDSLMKIINDILDYSKIEANKMEIESIDFDIYKLVLNIGKLYYSKSIKSKIDFNLYVQPGIPQYLFGDRERIKQILSNLIDNAIKFTEKGFVNLRVKLVNESIHDLVLEFLIEDSGIGIAEEHLDKIFHSFSQADTSTTRKFGGTGLGLSICNKLANLMNGKLTVESEVNKGSVFSLKIPLQKSSNFLEEDKRMNFKNNIILCSSNTIATDIYNEYLHYLGNTTEVISPNNILKKELADSFSYIFIDDTNVDNISNLIFSLKEKYPYKKIYGLISMSNIEVLQFLKKNNFQRIIQKPFMIKDIINVFIDEKINDNQNGLIDKMKNTSQIDKKILVVDDNSTNLLIVKRILERAGYKVYDAHDGEEGFLKVRENQYDLILMDIQMPKMNGIECTKKIRSLSNAKSKIPIIALTAYAMMGDREKFLQAGMNDYVAKPIEKDIFLKKIHSWTK